MSRHKGTHAIIRSAGVLLSSSRISHDFNLQDHPTQIRKEKRTCNDSLSAIGHGGSGGRALRRQVANRQLVRSQNVS